MNYIDIAVLVVIGVSTLIALSRGFVKEVLSILGWIGAVVATVLLFPAARPYAREYIASTLLADIVTGVAIFLITLFICGILNQLISRLVRGSVVSAFDRSLGLIFGLVRGVVIVCAAYILMIWAIPDVKDRPDMVANARTLPMVAEGADFLKSLVPQDVLEKGAAAVDQSMKSIEQGQAVNDTIQKLNGTSNGSPDRGALPATGNAAGQTQGLNQGGAQNPNGNPDGQASSPGYKDAERNDLNRLIESSQ